MRIRGFRHAVSSCAAAVLLTACGVLPLSLAKGQDDTSPPGAMPQIGTRTNPASTSQFEVLHSFAPAPDGFWPETSLVRMNGLFYGTTYQGGGRPSSTCNACGTVYYIDARGTEEVLHDFAGSKGNDGSAPEAALTIWHGTMYGTTLYGGKTPADCSGNGNGCGLVFEISPSGRERPFYEFKGGQDSSAPASTLVVYDNKLYGTTTGGGYGNGTVFAVTAAGTERALYHFTGGPHDGAYPSGNIVIVGGVIYGTTVEGGASNVGTVFKVTLDGKETILHSFSASDGEYPVGLSAFRGTLYGATSAGGEYKEGTIFSLTTSGTFENLHVFVRKGDGAFPYAPPIAANGRLYGTTNGGGTYDDGILYVMDLSGRETNLQSFGPTAEGQQPRSPLLYVGGWFYGTTVGGGTNDVGTAFRFKP